MHTKILIAAAAFALASSTVAFADRKNEIKAVTFDGDAAGTTRVHVRGETTPTFTVYKLEKPTRVVVDVPQARLGEALRGHESATVFSPNTWAVSTIAAQQLDDGGQVVRVVITLARPGRYDVKTDGNEVVVMVMPRDPQPAGASPEAFARANADAAAARDAAAKAEAKAAAAQKAADDAKAQKGMTAADVERATQAAVKAQAEAAQAKANADRAEREIASAKADANKNRAEADAAKQDATKTRAEAEAAKQLAAKAKADADAAKADATRTRAEADAAKRRALAEVDAAKKQKAQAEAARAEAEAARAETARAKADTARTKADLVAVRADASRAQADAARVNERTKAEADAARAEAARAKADAEVAKREAAVAREAAQKDLAMAEQAKRDAAKTRADAEAAQREATKKIAAAETAQREAEKSRGDVDAAKRDADRARAEVEAAKREVANAKTDTAKTRADGELAKREAARQRAEAELAKSEAAKTRADSEAAKKDAAKRLADAEASKSEAARTRADVVAANREVEVAKREAAVKRAEAEAAKREADQKRAEIAAAMDAKARAESAAQAAKADAAKARAEAAAMKADAATQIKQADADRRAAEAARADADRISREAKDKLAALDRKSVEAQAIEDKARAAAAAATAREEAAAAETTRVAKERIAAEEAAKRATTSEARAAEERLAAAKRATAEAEKQRVAAEAAAQAAKRELATSRATLATVEKQRTDAESAAVVAARKRGEAEAAATDANRKKTDAETAAQVAAKKKIEAEAAANQATRAKGEAEQQRVAIEAQKQAAEEALREAQAAKGAADKQRAVSEAATASAEQSRRSSEASIAALATKRAAAERAAAELEQRAKAEAKAQAEEVAAKARQASEAEIAKLRGDVARLAAERKAAESDLATRRQAVMAQQAEAEKAKTVAVRAKDDADRAEARRVELAKQAVEEKQLADVKADEVKAQQAAKVAQQRPAPAPVVKAATVRISDISFKGDDALGEIVIATSATARVAMGELTSTHAELVIDDAELAQKLERKLDVSKFGGPVKAISSFRDRRVANRVRLIAELAQPATPTFGATPGAITWKLAGDAPRVAKKQPPMRTQDVRSPVVAGFAAASTPLAQQTVAQVSQGRRRIYHGRTVSYDFKDASIHDLLRLIADTGGVNIVVPDSINPSVTVRLNRVPWDQALEVILASHGLWYRRDGNLYRIATRKEIDAEDEAEAARRAAAVAAENPAPQVVPLNYASAEELKTKLEGMLSQKGTLNVDPRTNALIINDVAGNREQITRLALQLDTQTPQISIEARIVEARSTFIRQIGVQWGGRATSGAGGGNATGLIWPSSIGIIGGNEDQQTNRSGVAAPSDFAVNLPAATGSGEGGALGMSLGSVGGNFNINLRLSALEDTGTIRIISAPKITVLNNKEAKISQGVSIPISVVSANGTQTQFVQADLSLTVTPYVSQSDCAIAMNLNVTKNEPDFVNVGARGDPTILRKEAKTSMLVQDGETSVLGGIYTRNTGLAYKKIPFFGDLPVIGWLFKNRRENDDRTEILVFITPKITNRGLLRCK